MKKVFFLHWSLHLHVCGRFCPLHLPTDLLSSVLHSVLCVTNLLSTLVLSVYVYAPVFPSEKNKTISFLILHLSTCLPPSYQLNNSKFLYILVYIHYAAAHPFRFFSPCSVYPGQMLGPPTITKTTCWWNKALLISNHGKEENRLHSLTSISEGCNQGWDVYWHVAMWCGWIFQCGWFVRTK